MSLWTKLCYSILLQATCISSMPVEKVLVRLLIYDPVFRICCRGGGGGSREISYLEHEEFQTLVALVRVSCVKHIYVYI